MTEEWALKLYEKMVEKKVKPIEGFILDEGKKAFFISKGPIMNDKQTMHIFEIKLPGDK